MTDVSTNAADLRLSGIVRSELLKMKAVRSTCILSILSLLVIWISAAGYSLFQAATKPGELTQDNFASIPAGP